MTKPKPTDTLLHVADIHYWRVVFNPIRLLNKRFLGNLNVALRRRHEYALDSARPHAETLAGTGVRALVMTGDFTSTALDLEYEAARAFVDRLRDLGFDITLMPGNHDVYTHGSWRSGRFAEYLGDYVPEGGYPSRHALPGGTPVIVVPTVRPSRFTSRGAVTHEEIAAVEALLADSREPVVMAGHYPFLEETYGYKSKWSRRLKHAAELRRVLGKSGKHILYLAGHVHKHSYVRDPDYPNLEQLTTGAFLKADAEGGVTGEFSEVRVRPDGFEVVRHTQEGDWKSAPVTL